MKMKKRVLVEVLAVAVGIASVPAIAQQKVYVFPQKGQSKDQQAIDESRCRDWARENSGVNPDAQRTPEQFGDNARGTAGGAARGAALGAGVGAIAGNAGKGAAAGAVVGGVAGRRRQKNARAAGEAENQNNFQRAFAACMEGKGYTVK